jgi:hypothetical protein
MKQPLGLAVISVLLAGCAELRPGGAGPGAGPSPAEPDTDFVPAAISAGLGAQAMSAAALDTTSAEEKAAALAAPATGAERELGRAVVALGPPAEQGLWMSTALVTAVAKGRVVTASGQSLALELRPGTGAALLSLAAFQALGLPLTGLPEVTVFGP